MTQLFAARSPLPGEEDVASGAPPVASGSGAKARAVPARRSPGKKVDEASCFG